MNVGSTRLAGETNRRLTPALPKHALVPPAQLHQQKQPWHRREHGDTPARPHQLTAMYDPSQEPPEVTVLVLGDADVGKSTFISRLSLGIQPYSDDSLPPYALPVLRDYDQPFTFNVSLYARPYSLAFYDTASPTSYTLLCPDFIILCYDISQRATLRSIRDKWLPLVNKHFNYDEALPVMVLGLKRDLRQEWTDAEKGADGKGRGESVMPQEGLGLASEGLCDRYAECSALTGELCKQVLEDVARTAAKTTTEKGAKSDGMECVVM
ncbi:P-loop containing nucleoside triphosphate hydrolase protein [Lentithecium fluviatile CBS 122367]|uniref:P-loop containing nucleoside triphosphate hydrolase protein n=1 Tax=Lentithecium fluviatile CBS 122367 TaxID=1168545 RepID=A0A6G1IYG1_9PLEO|nr:P-loop containing nucleoside triphosphate hydrolase protein [Lentithecium fluviatile CBS 122367]